MGRRPKDSSACSDERLRNGVSHPAATPEERQNQMISLAYDCAEQQLREGKASSQVITHFLKLGTIQAELELEKLKRENELLAAKTTAIESGEDLKRIYEDAIAAMQRYRGAIDDE